MGKTKTMAKLLHTWLCIPSFHGEVEYPFTGVVLTAGGAFRLRDFASFAVADLVVEEKFVVVVEEDRAIRGDGILRFLIFHLPHDVLVPPFLSETGSLKSSNICKTHDIILVTLLFSPLAW